MVITCFVKKCDGCDRCRQSADYLQQLAQDGNLGAAGRHLASRGIMLQALKQTRLFVSEVLDAEVADLKSYIPIESYYHEEILKIPEDHFLPYLPNYFTSLSTEVKRIARIEDFDSVWLREFVLHRLREFIQINCEYEVERNAALTNIQPPDISEVSLTDMSEILVKARSSRKSSKDEGVSAWESVTRILARTEDSPGSEDILDAYESVLEKVSGLFPTVIRFVERRERDNDYSALVETLLGDEFIIESQFPLSGDYAYLPPRFKYNPVDMKLLQKDRSKIIQSTRAVQGIYALQSVPIWEGAWSELMLKHFESFSLDFKREHPKKLAKHLAAFANTEGGWLVFGIFDPILDLSEGPVLGLKPREATNIINSVGIAGVKMLAPPILPTTCFRAYPNWKLVILYKILQSPVAPHKVKDLIYIREGARSDSISEDEWNDLVLSKNEGSQAKE